MPRCLCTPGTIPLLPQSHPAMQDIAPYCSSYLRTWGATFPTWPPGPTCTIHRGSLPRCIDLATHSIQLYCSKYRHARHAGCQAMSLRFDRTASTARSRPSTNLEGTIRGRVHSQQRQTGEEYVCSNLIRSAQELHRVQLRRCKPIGRHGSLTICRIMSAKAA